MNFIEYLAELQNKYNITNKEIREELSQSGKPLSKSYLSHKLSGERRITEDEFNLIVHTIRPTAAEEKKLRQLFSIYLYGEHEFKEVQRIREYIMEFADDTTPHYDGSGADLAGISAIGDEKTLIAVVLRLLSQAWGKEKIRIWCQPECKVVMDVLKFLSHKEPADVEHLLCLNNDYKRDSNVYNISSLKVLDKLVLRNAQHKIHYYYDIVYSRIKGYNVFPYFILTENMALLISEDCKGGHLIQDRALVLHLIAEFSQKYQQAEPLFEMVTDDVAYMMHMYKLEQEATADTYILQYHPCLALNRNEALTRSCIDEAYPHKEQLMQLFLERWELHRRINSHHLYSGEGKEEFLRTGVTSDMDPRIFRPLTPEERLAALQSSAENPTHHSMELNDGFLKIPASLSLFCTDSGRMLISFDNSSSNRLIMQERSMHRSMLHFFKYVLKYEAFK